MRLLTDARERQFTVANSCTPPRQRAASINYKTDTLAERLQELCPDGVDLYFDNVGGDTLRTVMDNLAMGARIVLCGSISEYMSDEPFGLTNYTRLRSVNGSMNGFFVYNFADRFAAAGRQLAEWIRQGKLQPVQNVVDGFDQMPAALASLYSGNNTGIQICRVRGEPAECAPLPAGFEALDDLNRTQQGE